MKPAIEVRGVSKCYTINHSAKASYNSLKDDFAKLFTGTQKENQERQETFWALKDVSFDVQKGEILGIIGKNGSGKSTLLKILSRIVDPTEGHIKLRGRVASLLEVGTGFHPELTGRENIYFNGSMLGMSRREITHKFDEIVAFSEVEKFIDTPVKFYSSGMYVRLAFSVAAHLDPDILILDEVLSVGDDAFQKKSLKKIKETMQNGATVLFVSHSMSAVEKLCNKALFLDKGRVKYLGETEFATEKYLEKNSVKQTIQAADTHFEYNSKKDAQFTHIEILGKNDAAVEALDLDEKWAVRLNYTVKEPCEHTIVAIEILTSDDQIIYMSTDTDFEKKVNSLLPGKYTSDISLPDIRLVPGVYYLRCSIQAPYQVVHDVREGIPIKIRRDQKDIRSEYYKGRYNGYISTKVRWNINRQELHD